MLKAKTSAITALTGGVEYLLKKNKVDYIKGTASFSSPTTLEVSLLDGGATQLTAKNVIIATGSEVTPFPGVEVDEVQIVSSTGALDLQKVPEKLVVIGAGVIGLELGSVWNRLGSKVEVIEYMNIIGGTGMDGGIAKSFQKILTKQGMKFSLNTKVIDVEKRDGKVFVNVEGAKDGKKSQVRSSGPLSDADGVQIEADVVLVAIGRRPYVTGLGLENINVEVDNKGRIVIDSEFNTSVKGVKCIGDVTFGPMLAHKAEEEGASASPTSTALTGQELPLSSSSTRATATSTTRPSRRWCTRTLRSHGLARTRRSLKQRESHTRSVRSRWSPTRAQRPTTTRRASSSS